MVDFVLSLNRPNFLVSNIFSCLFWGISGHIARFRAVLTDFHSLDHSKFKILALRQYIFLRKNSVASRLLVSQKGHCWIKYGNFGHIAGILNWILTLSRGRSWADDSGGGAKTPALRILAISRSFQVGVVLKANVHIIRPHVENEFYKIFCLPYKNSETSKKNQERAFISHFWIYTKKKLFFSNFQTMRKYHESS